MFNTCVLHCVAHIVSTELNVKGPHYQKTLKHIHEQKKGESILNSNSGYVAHFIQIICIIF